MNIEIMPINWSEEKFVPDNASLYSILKIDEKINGFIMGKSSCGCFSITLNPNAVDFIYKFSDFIQYENSYNRRVLIYSPNFDVNNAMENIKQFFL